MNGSFISQVRDALHENGGPVALGDIYQMMNGGKDADADFKRKIRRCLYHLGKSGHVKRVAPATYKYVQ